MSYIRAKTIHGKRYFYEQKSTRSGGKVKTTHVKYVGKLAPIKEALMAWDIAEKEINKIEGSRKSSEEYTKEDREKINQIAAEIEIPALDKLSRVRLNEVQELTFTDDMPIAAEARENGRIMKMSPEQFLDKAPMTYFTFERSSFKKLLTSMRKTKKTGTLLLEYDKEKNAIQGHEGRHRAFVAMILGVKELEVAYTGTKNPQDILDAKPQYSKY